MLSRRLTELGVGAAYASIELAHKAIQKDHVSPLSSEEWAEVDAQVEQLVLTGESLINLDSGIKLFRVINHSNNN